MSDRWHRRSITLFEGPSGSTRTREGAQVTFPDPPAGHAGNALRVTITDYGVTGNEYHLTVPPEEKDWLLLNLLQEYWQRTRPSPEVRDWLDEREIRYEDFGYWSGPTD